MLKNIGQQDQIELLKCTNHWHVYATTTTEKENPLKIQNIDVFNCHDLEIDARWYNYISYKSTGWLIIVY